MTNKTTKKDNFAEIASILADQGRDDLVVVMEKEIASLAKKAASAKAAADKKKAEGDALTDAILAVLTSDFQSIADIAAQVEGEDITTSKVQYRLGALVRANKAVKEQITVATESDKTRKVMGYAIA